MNGNDIASEAGRQTFRERMYFHDRPDVLELDFRACARPLQIAERRSFVAFLLRLQAARAAAVGLVLLTAALSACVLVRPWAPQPSAPPRECVGRFLYPDSVGHCIPRDTTGSAS